MRCLKFRDIERYQSASELLAALEDLDKPVTVDSRQELHDEGHKSKEQGNFAQAVTFFHKALEVRPQKDDRLKLNLTWELGKAYYGMTHSYGKAAYLDKAIQYLKDAESLDNQLVFLNRQDRLKLYQNLAAAYREKGATAPADYYDRKTQSLT